MNRIEIVNKKKFIATLLGSDCFDKYLLKEVYLKTSNTYTIDGRENKDFYSDSDDLSVVSPYEYSAWSKNKGMVFELIKGRNTPLAFKVVLYAPAEIAEQLIGNQNRDVQYLTLNIVYDESGMSVTSAVAYSSFTLDKDADNVWDRYVESIIEKE